MKGKLAVVPLIAAAAMAAASTARADPPTREPVPLEPFTFPAGQVCSFPLQVEALRDKEKITTFSDGRMRLTGSFVARLTNPESGRSIVVNASGPGWLDGNPNVSEGGGLVFLFPGDVGGPGAYAFHGRVLITFDDAGNIVELTSTGRRSGNLCDLIA
jgi:hypothetical protein